MKLKHYVSQFPVLLGAMQPKNDGEISRIPIFGIDGKLLDEKQNQKWFMQHSEKFSHLTTRYNVLAIIQSDKVYMTTSDNGFTEEFKFNNYIVEGNCFSSRIGLGVYAYVENITDPFLSEFGSIGIIEENGLVRRCW